MKKHLLEIIVFLCGAVVMIFELAGSRVLGPYLGTSIFIWTSLIGIILGSLSLGYWLGGRLADRKPSPGALAWIILAAGLFIGFTTLVKGPFLKFLPEVINGLKWQSVVASVFLFAPASVFLGMVSPYAVRLKIKALQTSGATVGRLYAISTVGSIAGTFAAGFYLIPAIGTTSILIAITILLLLISIVLFIISKIPAGIIAAVLLVLVNSYILYRDQSGQRVYVDVDTQYSRVWIYDATDQATGRPIRFMRINNESSSAEFHDSREPVFPYMRYYRLAEHFTPGFRSALILGGAAFSYPKYFLQRYPQATLDVVEIDPELTELARKYFNLRDDPRMRIFHEDARTFLNRSEYRYDVIFGDTYKSLYTLPWHLTTREAAQKSYDMLNDGGCVILNIISSIGGESSLFLQAETATYRDVFPHVYIFAADNPQNEDVLQGTLLVALKTSSKPGLTSSDPDMTAMLKNNVTHLIAAGVPLLTDDFAPVDFYTNKSIR
ncbi:MAG: fused MFS/spermidine synthase [Bacteroidales bacterium]|nr:fused MFS/spermidine synthase [Bacteroidales bacterium]